MAQDPLQEEFDRFVAFGTLLDRRTRQYLVQYLHARLDPNKEFPDELDDTYYRYFQGALDQIFEATDLQQLVLDKPRLSQQIASDVLFWMRKAYQQAQEDHPYAEEVRRLGTAGVMPISQLAQQWPGLIGFLEQEYLGSDFELPYYRKQLEDFAALQYAKRTDPAATQHIERVFHDLLAQWDARLNAKILQWQLRRLDQSKESFQELVEAKVQEYQKLYDLIDPFADYLGNYWDLSRSLWEDSSFDVVNRYDELLKNEDSVRELADMLGRMRQAEMETEEEILEKVIIRQEWISDPLQRTEIVGSHASQDLNFLLSSEIGLLSDPDTETAFLKKFADHGLQTFRFEDQKLVESEEVYSETYERVKRKEKGPFIICVDTSESMAGTAEHIAKVVCYAILKMAGRENRRAYLINFSSGIQTLDLHNIGGSLDSIAAFLRMSFHGGTNISPALYEVMRQLEQESYRDADVLIISDFILYRIEDDLMERIRFHQQNNGTQFHSLTLHEDPNAEVIGEFDSNWLYDPEQKGIMRELAGKLRSVR